ncbi:MAG: 50S ribosomal protein L10, partial [Alkalibacterium sp.]|nr:50S ribosomal protein L10 [Alkalibacterium sp.]
MSKANVIAKKEEIVNDITKKFQDAEVVVVMDYRGLTVDEVTELRKQLRDAGVEMRVLKNTMLRRASEAAGLNDLVDVFKGPTAVAFSNEEVVAPAKIIAEFAKDAEALEIKGGVLEGKVASVEQINKIATLPS